MVPIKTKVASLSDSKLASAGQSRSKAISAIYRSRRSPIGQSDLLGRPKAIS
jgi:hypothetical protein